MLIKLFAGRKAGKQAAKKLSRIILTAALPLAVLAGVVTNNVLASAPETVFLNDTFDRPDSTNIGTDWTGYTSQHKILNNALVRNGTSAYANILINFALMSADATGYVIEIEGARPTPLIYFQDITPGNGNGYFILIRDNDGTNAVQLWKQAGTTQSLIMGYQVPVNSWAAANKITVVAVSNQAKFNIFKDGIYDGYLVDPLNTFTKGYCGIRAKGNGAVEAESFKCYGYSGTYFDDSTGQGYIANGEYNLADGQTYGNLTILKTGILNITNASVKLNTSDGVNRAIKSYGGILRMESATITPSDINTWAQIKLTTTVRYYG